MNKLYTLLTSLVLLSTAVFGQLDPKVKSLADEKDYFQLRDLLKDSKLDAKSRDYAQALVYNAFGEYTKSIGIVNNWKQKYSPAEQDSLYKDLLSVNIDNYIKTNQFADASRVSKQVVSEFSKITDSEEVKDIENSAQIWSGLASTPAQQVVVNKTAVIPFTRDIAKLVNIKVEHPGGSTNSVFDTGANISVASESTAAAMKLKIVAEGVAVKAITGNEVQAKIGVADELKIGDITVKNACFLIFPDADLTFGNVYKIDMIVGFPIIMGMGEITIDQTANTMSVAKDPKPRNYKNLCVDGLTPIVQIQLNKTPIQLSFDSGADKTMFYKRFYDMVKDNKDIELTAGKSTLGGAGGAKTIDIMIAKHLELQVAGEKVELSKSDVLQDNLMDKKEHLYGNLGQDVLKSRKQYVINLRDMYFELHD